MNSITVPSTLTAVKFESSGNFRKGDDGQITEDTFGKYQRRQRQLNNDRRQTNSEVLSTLLSSFGESAEDYSQNLVNEQITYRDLSSLQDKDLILMGFKDKQQRESMLELFQQLPRQNPSYNRILKSAEAKSYNRTIFNNATTHLETMRSALAAANYKLKITPSEDVIVGEKSFASRFVVEAVEELRRATVEIESQLVELDKAVNGCCKNYSNSSKTKHGKGKFKFLSLFGMATTIGILAAIWFCKSSWSLKSLTRN